MDSADDSVNLHESDAGELHLSLRELPKGARRICASDHLKCLPLGRTEGTGIFVCCGLDCAQ